MLTHLSPRTLTKLASFTILSALDFATVNWVVGKWPLSMEEEEEELFFKLALVFPKESGRHFQFG